MSRPLTQSDWDILQSYTHRIRSIRSFKSGLNRKSIEALSNPPTTGPLFPNLCVLRCEYAVKTIPLLHMPLPSLVFLDVKFENPHLFQDSLKSFPKFSPNITTIFIHVQQLKDTFSKIEPNYICRWRNLCSVICPQIALDVDALAHLSRMPALTQLTFAMSATLPASDSPLIFSNLHDLTLHSKSLDPIARLFSHTRLHVITNFTARIDSCPSGQELSSFLAGVPTSNAGHTIKRLQLTQTTPPSSNVPRSELPLLGLEDLRPCMAFSDLRHIELNIECNVGLTDTQLLTLASTWPKLERFLINVDWGWGSLGGITPGGLVRLLETCRSLREVALVLDTRGYTESRPSQSLGLTLPPEFLINLVDSVIEAESVPAVAAFFSDIATCVESDFLFCAWTGASMITLPNSEEYMERWDDVSHRVDVVLGRCSEFGD